MKTLLFVIFSFVLLGCGGGATSGGGVFEVPALPEKSQNLSANVDGSIVFLLVTMIRVVLH